MNFSATRPNRPDPAGSCNPITTYDTGRYDITLDNSNTQGPTATVQEQGTDNSISMNLTGHSATFRADHSGNNYVNFKIDENGKVVVTETSSSKTNPAIQVTELPPEAGDVQVYRVTMDGRVFEVRTGAEWISVEDMADANGDGQVDPGGFFLDEDWGTKEQPEFLLGGGYWDNNDELQRMDLTNCSDELWKLT